MNLRSIFYFFLTALLLYLTYLISYFPLHNEIHLSNDIGRDFLLLQELDQKKIVFIGARSNTQGVFHGPLWTYVNYPAYLIGKGDPLVVAWFWVLLAIAFLISTYFIVKKMFGSLPAIAAVLLLSVRLIPHVNSVFSPEAMFFVMPFFIYTIYMYLESKKLKYLVFHLISVGIFTQLNIGVGLLFIFMSSIFSLFIIFKNKLFKHLAAFFALPLVLSTFILFDIKHGFTMAKALLATGNSSRFFVTIHEWFQDRIGNLISIQLLSDTTGVLLFVDLVFVILVIATILQIKQNSKFKNAYIIFCFYYFGYMALSYFNKGIMLYHYIHLLIPLTTIWLVSFLGGTYKKVFAVVIIIVFLLNLNFAKNWVSDTQRNIVGKSPDSWTSLKTVADSIINEQKGKEFGYFVFSPDSFAYQQRYAMIYEFKANNAKAFEYVKKSITYIIASPPPTNDPYMTNIWWDKNEVKIINEPVEIKTFPSGYKTEKFNLSDKEQKVPFDPTIQLGISFR